MSLWRPRAPADNALVPDGGSAVSVGKRTKVALEVTFDARSVPAQRGAGSTAHQRGLERILVRCLPQLMRYFSRRIGRDVDDLVQQTVLAAWEGRHRFEGRSSPRAFLFGCARNVLRAHLRGLQRQHSFDADSAESGEATPEAVLSDLQQVDRVRNALEALPMRERFILHLYYWDELKTPTISRLVSIPEGTAKSRRRRAIERLAGTYKSLAW